VTQADLNLNLKELPAGTQADPQINSDLTVFSANFSEWSLNPKLFAQAHHLEHRYFSLKRSRISGS
jgi:hypothetical protein